MDVMQAVKDKFGNMTLREHLEELRMRLIWSGLAILVASVAAFFLSDVLLKALLIPSNGLHLNAFSLMDGFMIKWRLSLYTGIAFAFPVWGYHLYRFIAPGLLENERKVIFPTLVGSLVLFILGVLFGYYLLWGMIRVMVGFFPPEVAFLPGADDYISFVLFFLLACGISFQLPTLLIMAVQLHLIDSHFMTKQRRYAYFILFVFSEIITPVSDPIVAPLTVMVPLILLYELSIRIARRIEAGRARSEASLTVGK